MTRQEFEKIAMEESVLMCTEAAAELHDDVIALALTVFSAELTKRMSCRLFGKPDETFAGKKVSKVEEDDIDDLIRKIIGK
jgi:hypothetical protein